MDGKRLLTVVSVVYHSGTWHVVSKVVVVLTIGSVESSGGSINTCSSTRHITARYAPMSLVLGVCALFSGALVGLFSRSRARGTGGGRGAPVHHGARLGHGRAPWRVL